jgi:hypothetical protein
VDKAQKQKHRMLFVSVYGAQYEVTLTTLTTLTPVSETMTSELRACFETALHSSYCDRTAIESTKRPKRRTAALAASASTGWL